MGGKLKKKTVFTSRQRAVCDVGARVKISVNPLNCRLTAGDMRRRAVTLHRKSAERREKRLMLLQKDSHQACQTPLVPLGSRKITRMGTGGWA